MKFQASTWNEGSLFCKRSIISILVSALFCVTANGFDEARIQSRGGAPVITLDGKPVVSTCFYGSSIYDYPHSGSTEPRGRHCLHRRQRGVRDFYPKVIINQTPREYSIVFTTTQKADHTGMLRFIADKASGDIVLDNIRVEELKTGQAVFPVSDFEDGIPIEQFWRCLPKGKKPKVASAIKFGCGKDRSSGLILSFPSGFEKATYSLQLCSLQNLVFETNTQYKISFWAYATSKRKLTVSLVHRTETENLVIGSAVDMEGVFEEQIRLAATAGVNFITFPLGLPWPKPGETPFWEGIDITCERILKVNPNAILIPRIRLDPPIWWLDQYPDEEFRPSVSSNDSIRVAAVGSLMWRKEAQLHLCNLVKYMEKKFGKHVAGYHLCAQNSCEWLYPHSSVRGNISDTSAANIKAWQRWLQNHYVTVGQLRKAWNCSVSSFQTAGLPDYAYRMRLLNDKPFLNPVSGGKERMVIDYQRYQQEVMTEAIILFAKSVKDETAGKKLVVVFYGSNFYSGGINGPSATGHRNSRSLLNSPYVDILCAPLTYGYCRALGGGAYPVTATESISLAGKMWWNEDDTRTHLSRLPKGASYGTGKAESQEDSLNLLTRNLGQEHLRNLGTWWMDLGMCGWFNDPVLWARMEQMTPIGEYFVRNPLPWKGEIALLTDEYSAAYVPNPLVSSNLAWRLLAWGRSGVPFGQYLFDDFLTGKIDARLYVVMNAIAMTAADRAKVLKAAKGKNIMFAFGVGYIDPNMGMSVKHLQDLTGFQIREVSNSACHYTVSPEGKRHRIELVTHWSLESDKKSQFGISTKLKTVFAAVDAKPEETLITHPDGTAAVAIREKPEGGFVVFCGIPFGEDGFYRYIIERAGVQRFTRENCNVYVNGSWAVLHASQDGNVHFTAKGVWEDFLEKKVLPENNVVFSLKKGDTKILRKVETKP